MVVFYTRNNNLIILSRLIEAKDLWLKATGWRHINVSTRVIKVSWLNVPGWEINMQCSNLSFFLFFCRMRSIRNSMLVSFASMRLSFRQFSTHSSAMDPHPFVIRIVWVFPCMLRVTIMSWCNFPFAQWQRVSPQRDRLCTTLAIIGRPRFCVFSHNCWAFFRSTDSLNNIFFML